MELLHYILEWLLCGKSHAKPQNIYALDGNDAVLLWTECPRCKAVVERNTHETDIH
jgi:hypothetical protein